MENIISLSLSLVTLAHTSRHTRYSEDLLLTDRECEVVVEDPGVLVDVLVVDILTLLRLRVLVMLLHLWYEVI